LPWASRIAASKLTLITRIGKPNVAASIVASVTPGAWPFNEGAAVAGSAIMRCAEDDAADTIVPRLVAAGADLARAHIVQAVEQSRDPLVPSESMDNVHPARAPMAEEDTS
jgi:hypothetical protein